MGKPLLISVTSALVSATPFATAQTVFDPAQLTPVAAAPSVLFGDANPFVRRVQASAADKAWRELGENPSPAQIMMFLEDYPRSAHDTEAKRQLLKALESELTEQADISEPLTEPNEDAAASTVDTPADATVENAALPVEAATVDDGIVRFSVPLFHGDSQVVGKTLEELIAGSPLFPPVEGLPEEYWKEQTCKNCHEWQQTNLCEQANFYLTDKGAASLTKQHPYGGSFKENLRVWAVGDCQ